jgi:two-component system sensor histidine kinase TctE
VNWLFTPLYLLFLFALIAGYIAAVGLSNRPYDLLLTERARQLAARIDDRRPGLTAETLERAHADGLRVALYHADGRLLSGDAALPKPRPIDLADGNHHLHDVLIGDAKTRLLTLRLHAGLALQVAEPTDERLSLSRRILGHIVIPQILFILVAGLAVWIGLKKGLAPLERLRRQLAGRARDDLQPLDETVAPSEVRPFIREINDLLERQAHSLDSQRRFVADAAHQLRTPFAGLKAQAELAYREVPDGPLHESLERICQGARRCTRLVNQLLALARNEPQALAAAPDALLDLHRLARDAALRWSPEALALNIDLGFEADERQLPVRGDEAALNDLLDNLLDNAVHYTPAGGRVTLRLGYAAGVESGAWLRVEDDGPGIPPALHDKVFERFWRQPGNRQPGSGLGLAIVAEVALRHGARLRVEDGEQGRGVAFVVSFPHHAQEEEAA